MTRILLVGPDAPLLEGLAQTLAAHGHAPRVTGTLGEAREVATTLAPVVAVVDRAIAVAFPAEVSALSAAPGGALVLYRTAGSTVHPLPHLLQRQVLADLALPLERNRLAALVQHVQERAVATGHSLPDQPEHPGSPEQPVRA
jgi:DNA-binding NtrC family response regulator